MLRYHRSLGFPVDVTLPRILRVEYTRHALEEAINEEYGRIQVPGPVLDTASARVCQYETEDNGSPLRINVEFPYSAKYKLNLVLDIRDPARVRVVTMWLNTVDWNYPNLDLTRYVRPNRNQFTSRNVA